MTAHLRDASAAVHDVPVAVALAPLRAQPTVVARVAIARVPEQVAPLAASLDRELTPDELAALDAAGRAGPKDEAVLGSRP